MTKGKRVVLILIFSILIVSLLSFNVKAPTNFIRTPASNSFYFGQVSFLESLAIQEPLINSEVTKESQINDDKLQEEIIEKNGTKYIVRDGKKYLLSTASSTYYIKFDPPLPSSVCENEKIDITVKGKAKFYPDASALLDCDWDGYTWVNFDLYLMEDDAIGDDEVAYQTLGVKSYDCDSVYFEWTFKNVDLSDWIISDPGDNGEFYVKIEDGLDNIKEMSTSSYDVYGYVNGECQCLSGACCDLGSRPYKYKPSGSQPTGYNDIYFCDPSGSSPTGTNYAKKNDYYCNGQDASRHNKYVTLDTCGTCEYCKYSRYSYSRCDYYGTSTKCGTKDCDYKDTACRDYHDVNKYCNGAGSCSIAGSCNDYTNEPKHTSCGTGKECDGNGNCITCTSHEYYSCYDNDVYWYDKCDNREEKKEECGEDLNLWSYYCEGKDVYKDAWFCVRKGCSGGACYDDSYECPDNTQHVYVETCPVACVDGECRDIACSQDSDCGTDHWAGSGYCKNNDVYSIWVTYTCHKPGTVDSYCTYNEEEKKLIKCGEDYCEAWGENYCKDDDVYHSRTCHDKGCSEGACYDNTYEEEEKVQECGDAGCSGGECIAAKNITVCKSGDCDYTTIQEALDVAVEGSIIQITDKGVYNEQLEWKKDKVTLDCQGAILDGDSLPSKKYTCLGESSNASTGIFICEKDYVLIKNCKIRNFQKLVQNNKEIGVGILIGNGSSITIINNTLLSNDAGAALNLIKNLQIRRNEIKNNTLGGLFIGDSNFGNVTNNIISLNGVLYPNRDNFGIGLEDVSNMEIKNNLFCPSNYVDFKILWLQSVTGSNNTCDKPGSWNDAGTVGCTYTCCIVLGNSTVYVEPDYTKVSINKNFTIDIDINTKEEIYTVGFELNFDSSLIEALEVKEGNFLKKDGASTYPIVRVNNSEGKIEFSNTRLGEVGGVSGEGSLAVLEFYSKSAGSSNLILTNVTVLNIELNGIPISTSNGIIEVTALEGDVDGNCKVDIFDLAAVGLCYGCQEGQECWTSEECYKADLSGNKKVDIFDLDTVGLNYGNEC